MPGGSPAIIAAVFRAVRTGNAFEETVERLLARQAFGADVVEHYANYAKVELAAYDAAVTDWELRRCFERL